MADKIQTSLDVAEQSSSPGSPASGYYRLYAKTDGKMYGKNSGGTEFDLTATGKGITWNISGAGAVISTGGKDDSLITFPYSGTITGWYITSKESATVTVDIWKHASSVPVNGDSITASAKLTLTAAQFNDSTTLTGWTTAITAGDKFKVEVEANDLSKDLKITLIIS